MKYICYLLIAILISIFFMMKTTMFYKDIDSNLIGLPISQLEEIIGEKYIDFGVKEFVGFPYKIYSTGCGKGY